MYLLGRLAISACAVIVLARGGCLWATDADPSDRFARSASYDQRTAGRVFRDSVDLHFFGDREAFAWYRIQTGPDEHEFIVVDTAARQRRRAFDHQRLAEQLGGATGEQLVASRLPIRILDFSADAREMRFAFQNRTWVWRSADHVLVEAEADAESDSAGLPPLDVLARSRGGGDSTRIEITNRIDRPLNVFWHDGDGDNRLYGRIEPGGQFTSSTYEGHVWLLVDDGDEWVAAFSAHPSLTTAVVDARTTAPAPRQADRGRTRGDSPKQGPERVSPDGRWSISFRDWNAHLRNRETDEETPLSTDGSEQDGFGGNVWWSPDSQHAVVLRTRRAPQRQLTLVESAPRDQLQPKTITVDYTKPGDPLDHPRPHLFHVGQLGGEAIIDDSLFPNPFALDHYRWSADSSEFTFVYNQRGHQVLRWIGVDATTGKPRIIIDETSPTFVCYSSKFFLHPLEETGEAIWMTERDGWNHVILVDTATGREKCKITRGEWVVREVERVDEERRQVWLAVGGIHAGEDPYHRHLIRVNFDGTGLTHLTAGDGTHRWEYSPAGRWLIDTYSRVDLPPVTHLRDAETGASVCELEQADWSALLATGWTPPERFVAKGRDGTTDIYGVVVRPTDFDPAKSYPVLESIYAGPQASFTPKQFGRHHDLYEMAELGFIVVKLDGMGTSDRSKAFHDVCWQNLGDSGFPDRIAWMRQAALTRPEMDLQRIGIWGGSAGGQSALRALLAYGDFYQAAAADCGCHDNRMDKIWWNEQWMGWPVGPHYEDQSNVTQAHRLRGKLLLTVGELDRNVDPASTMQVVQALIAADKPFELVVFPGGGHGSGSSPYGKRLMKDFFVRSLGSPRAR